MPYYGTNLDLAASGWGLIRKPGENDAIFGLRVSNFIRGLRRGDSIRSLRRAIEQGKIHIVSFEIVSVR